MSNNNKQNSTKLTHPLQLLIWQTHAVLHPHLIAHPAVLAQDRDTLHLDPVLHDTRRVAAHGRRRAFDARPGTHAAVPPDDGVQHARVVLDLDVLEDDGFLDADTGADDGAGSDGDVGAEFGRSVHLGGAVDEDGRDDVGGRRGELFGLGLPCFLQVEGVGRDGGAGGLDLAPEIFGLEHEELFAVGEVGEDVLLQAEDFVLLAVLELHRGDVGVEVLRGWVRDHAGAVGAAFDGGFDGGEDGFGGEEVDAAIDEIGDVRFGLLDVVQDALGVGVGDDAAEVCGGVVTDAGAQDDGFGVFFFEELEHVAEREGAADVGVENKEAVRATLEDDVAEVVKTSRCS